MNSTLLLLLLNIFMITSSKEYANKLDRYLITCHTTDFVCFKRQYKALRDNLLLGNQQLAISFYEPYVFRYGDTGTCVKLSGVEDSELVAISMNSNTKQYSLVIELPFNIQQIMNSSVECAIPDKEFGDIGPQEGEMKMFSGNATVTMSYPYKLHKKKGDIYMILEDENIDVILDIPDLSLYDEESEIESKLYAWSEWAYEMVQHVDIAQHSLAPYSGQLKKVMERLPLEKFLLLYPEEEYSDLQFSFAQEIAKVYE